MPFRFSACLTVVCVAVSLAAPQEIAAAELAARTTEAYDRYIATLLGEFSKRIASDMFLEHGMPPALDRLRRGEVLLDAGSGDGIIDAPNGLIHHWRATVFIPDVTLERLLKTVQDYPAYASLYNWLVASELLNVDGDRYRTFFRAKRSSGVVTGVLDLWMTTEYQRLAPDRVTSIAKAECVRQVEHAGEGGEHRLRPGLGSGYLWRADALSKYLERDGGVYVELDAIGLSRGYPPLLGWVIEPVARRLGRESAASSLNTLRKAIISPPVNQGKRSPVNGSGTWCGE
jgi:hypothetical protein